MITSTRILLCKELLIHAAVSQFARLELHKVMSDQCCD